MPSVPPGTFGRVLVPDDGVVGNAGLERGLIQQFQYPVVRVQSINSCLDF